MGTSWVNYSGYAKSIAAGGDSSIVIIGINKKTQRTTGVFKLRKSSRSWVRIGDIGHWIAAGPGGRLHIVTKKGLFLQSKCS
jgi:hypothetical protein